jgi:RES domain-containing protein
VSGEAWRLCRRPHADLRGEGGLRADGRWHRRGRPVVYAAETAALAALDVLVHLDLSPELLPADYVLLRIAWRPDVAITELGVDDLPAGWAAAEGAAACRELGDAWLRRGTTALLRVPSAIVPVERNLLLNPRHPDRTLFQVVRIEPFSFDSRLLQRSP